MKTLLYRLSGGSESVAQDSVLLQMLKDQLIVGIHDLALSEKIKQTLESKAAVKKTQPFWPEVITSIKAEVRLTNDQHGNQRGGNGKTEKAFTR